MEEVVLDDHPKFKFSGGLLTGTTLAFAYEVGTETGIVREKLVSLPLTSRYHAEKNDAMNAAVEVVYRSLQKKYEDASKISNRKQRKNSQENLEYLMRELKNSSAPGDSGLIEFIPSEAREVDGVFLPVGAPIYVVDNDRDDGVVQHYKIGDYKYFGGRVLHYQCVPVKAPHEAEDFRIASDYIMDEGQVSLPASRGERFSMFWTKFGALEYLSNHSDSDICDDLLYEGSSEDLDAMINRNLHRDVDDLDPDPYVMTMG